MQDLLQAFNLAVTLVLSGNSDLFEIVSLSLRVSVLAVVLACVIGLPIGALVGVSRFRGRSVVLIAMNALLGLPPVVVGLLVYLHLSNAGPLGWLQLLYTPTAMVIAQTILIAPIIAALSRQVIEDLHHEYSEQFQSFGLSIAQRVKALIWDARFSLLTVVLAGFGRSISEVGAVIIVGGNIAHLTRVMTTAIALETSKGDLALAMALGLILLALSLLVNALVAILHGSATRLGHA